MNQDQKFFDTFMIIIGFLIGLTVVIYFIATGLYEHYLAGQELQSNIAQTRLESRLAPIGMDRISGTASASMGAPEPASSGNAAASAGNGSAKKSGELDGHAIWQANCFACHGTGAAGAPKIGDKNAWGPRIAKGLDTLESHAINGFQSNGLVMPAKGGNPGLSDAEVKAAVKYMVGQSK